MTNAYECTTQPQRSQAADPLRTRDFRLLVAGLGISLFANLMLRFAMSMWVLDETGSAAAFASILTASILPTILLSPLGGVMADRTNRRTVMVALDALSAVTVLVCAAIFSAAGFNLAAIAVMQVVLAVLDAMETPTVQAALPQMFRSHGEDVMRRAMAVVNVVNQNEHARSRRARRRAVRGGWCDAHDGPHDRGVRCGRRRGVFHPARRSRPRRRRPRHRGRRPARGRTFPHPRTSSCAASGVDLRRAQLPGDGVCGGRLPLHGADRTGVRLHGVRPCIWSRGSIRTARRARRWAGREVAVHAAIPDGDRRLLAHHPAPSACHDDSRRWSDATRGAHGEHLRNHDRHHPREPHRRAGDPDGLPREHDRQGDVARALREHVRPAPRTDRIRLGVQRLPGGRGPGGDVRPGHRDAAASRARNAAVLGRDSITFALDS